VRLTGIKDTNISGNGLANVLIGNSGNNIIDGKGGNNVVQFSGASNEYKIEKGNGVITVSDFMPKRDGTDQLKNIEILRFRDEDITL
jgi:Ca2+-binding RTX toxin-like protein